MKSPMKKLFASCIAAIGLTAFAEPTVKFTNVKEPVLCSGEISYTCTTAGFEGKQYDLVIEVGADGAEAKTVTLRNVAEGTETKTLDVKALLGKVYPSVTLFAELKERSTGGVQLWKGGPYFADRNVGATKPEDPGYWFWWGDTVGYYNAGKTWVSSADGKTTILFQATDTTATTTYQKTNAELKEMGYIDASGNLVAEHDAARVHLGGTWRMPTDAEFNAMVANTTMTRVTDWNGTGVSGYVVTGKGDYAVNSIFLPAGGIAITGGTVFGKSVYGNFWSSTPKPTQTNFANSLNTSTSEYGTDNDCNRFWGFSVRPVRDAE